ncbi:hypothetical protein GCM10020331_039620 [Ectobacillus funiculus]
MTSIYDIQQLLKKFGTIIYTGDRVADLELMADELHELHEAKLIEATIYEAASFVLRQEMQKKQKKTNYIKGCVMQEKWLVGVDLGGTTIKLAFISVYGEILHKWEIPTNISEKGKYITVDIAKAIDEKAARTGRAKRVNLQVSVWERQDQYIWQQA